MRNSVIALGCWALAACAAPTPGPAARAPAGTEAPHATPPQPSVATPATASAPWPEPGVDGGAPVASAGTEHRALAARFVGAGSPTVVVHNALPIPQYVWLDEALLGEVNPAAERSFAVPTGAHSLTFSDSPTRQQAAGFVAELYDAGYRYDYEVVAR